MEHLESKELCAHLTGNIGRVSADTFYKMFNLISTHYSEFYFRDMLEIFHLEGMDQWLEMYRDPGVKQQPEEQSPIFFSLVCFQPPTPATSLQKLATDSRIAAAHAKASAMVCSTFESKEDHDAINVAMSNFLTMAIFMSQISRKDRKKKSKNSGKSIFDVKDLSVVHCLAAVNYFRQGTHTQVL